MIGIVEWGNMRGRRRSDRVVNGRIDGSVNMEEEVGVKRMGK